MALQMSYNGPDLCNKDGARRLKERIEEYWRERGRKVEVKIVEAGFVPTMRSAREDVRSDMKNGFPPKKLETQDDAPMHFAPAMVTGERQLELMI